MTSLAPDRRRAALFVAVVLALALTEWSIARIVASSPAPDLIAGAMTLDLVVGIPALVGVFFVRSRRLSPWSLIPAFFAALVLAHVLVPRAHAGLLTAIERASPAVEVVVLAALVVRGQAARRIYLDARAAGEDTFDAWVAALEHALGSPLLARMVATELAIIVYGLGGWFLRAPASRLTQHRGSGHSVVMGTFAGLSLLETWVAHLVMATSSTALAWVVTALSLYGTLWLAGELHTVRLRPSRVERGVLRLRTGVRMRADIELDAIARVDVASGRPAKTDVSFAPSGEPTAWLVLTREVTVEGLFGRRRRAKRVGISPDDLEAFRAHVRAV